MFAFFGKKAIMEFLHSAGIHKAQRKAYHLDKNICVNKDCGKSHEEKGQYLNLQLANGDKLWGRFCQACYKKYSEGDFVLRGNQASILLKNEYKLPDQIADLPKVLSRLVIDYLPHFDLHYFPLIDQAKYTQIQEIINKSVACRAIWIDDLIIHPRQDLEQIWERVCPKYLHQPMNRQMLSSQEFKTILDVNLFRASHFSSPYLNLFEPPRSATQQVESLEQEIQKLQECLKQVKNSDQYLFEQWV